MDKPVIGIMPLVDVERESYWMLPGYMKAVSAAGGIPIMLSLTEDEGDIRRMASMCDGFIFTGGQDSDPAMYGEVKRAVCGECVEERDVMETVFFQEALKSNKPCLGICRGYQLFNILLGGTIYQDLPTDMPSEVVHRQGHPYDEPSHEVSVLPGTPLEKLAQSDKLAVNSLHHQGVNKLAEKLVPMAVAPDGIVEAVYMPSRKFVWGLQWHPEYRYTKDKVSRDIFNAFVKACN